MSSDLPKPWECGKPIVVDGRSYCFESDAPETIRDGNRVWPGAIAMAERLCQHPESLGKVCDLGCGLGLVGMVATRFASSVVMLDCDEKTCALAASNLVKHNVEATVLHAKWNEIIAYRFDTILGADVLYHAYGMPLLADFIEQHWTRQGRCWFINSTNGSADEFASIRVERELNITVEIL